MLKRLPSLVLTAMLLESLFAAISLLPIQVQAYTQTFQATTSDGGIFKVDSDYNNAWSGSSGTVDDTSTGVYLGQKYAASQYYIYRVFLFFDTSGVPDSATITSAILSLNTEDDSSIADFTITVQNGQPTYPHNPLQSTDYDKSAYSNVGGERSTSEFPGSSYNAYFNITLNSNGRSWINKAGTTKLALRSSKDISGTPPTDANHDGYIDDEYVELFCLEKGAGYGAKLYVSYSIAPTVDSLSLTNPSNGTQGCLAQKQAYTFRVKASDVDGGSNLNYVQVYLDPTGQNLQYRWTQASDSFSEVSDPNGYASISSTGGDSSLSGTQWTLDFKITFAWTYPDESTHSVKVYVLDDDGLSDTETYSSIYFVENDLTASGLQVSDYHANPGQTLTMSGYWYYQGSSTPPPDGDYQVNVTCSGAQYGSTDASLVSGAFSISDVSAPSVVGLYSFKVSALHMAGEGSFSDVVVDKLLVTISANATNPAVNDPVGFTVSAVYDYDDSVASFSYVNSYRNTTHYASAASFTDTQLNPLRYKYTLENVSDDTYGITAFSSNTVTVVWGTNIFIEAYGISIDDNAINVGSSTYLRYQLRFSGNQSDVGSGTLWVNGTSHTISSGWANFTVTEASVGIYRFVVTAVDVNGETDYGQIPSNPNVVWDRIDVYYEQLNDSRVSVNQAVQFRVKAKLEVLFAFNIDSLTSNIGSLSWSTSNLWWYGSKFQASVGSYTFNITAGSETASGVTAIHCSVSDPVGVWDRVKVYSQAVNDSRVSVGSPIEFRVKALLEYDSAAVSSTSTVQANLGPLTWDSSNSWFDGSKTLSAIGNYTFNVTAFSEPTYGVSAFTVNVSDPVGVWDALNVSEYSVDMASAKLYVKLLYSYDGTAVSSGNVSFSSTVAATNSSGWAEYTLTSFSDFGYGLPCYGLADNTYGVTATGLNQSIAVAKKVFPIYNLNGSTATLSGFTYSSNQLSFSATGTGVIILKAYCTASVYYVKIGSVIYYEGDQWMQSGNLVTVSDVLGSTHSYIISFQSYNPPTQSGSSSSTPKSLTEQAAQFIQQTVPRAAVTVASNMVSVFILGGLIVGTVGTFAYDREGRKWKILLFFTALLAADFFFAYIIVPMGLLPQDLSILRTLAWTPPQLALQTAPLGTQMLVQLGVLASVGVIAMVGVFALILRE